METLFENRYKSNFVRTNKGKVDIDRRVFGKRVGLFGKVFGCLHRELSRPFTRGNIGYRACLECGARTPFDNDTFKTFGHFYYPPEVELEKQILGF